MPKSKINVVDINEEKIKALNNKDLTELPVFEQGLAEILKRCRGKIYSFQIQ